MRGKLRFFTSFRVHTTFSFCTSKRNYHFIKHDKKEFENKTIFEEIRIEENAFNLIIKIVRK